MKLKFIVAIVAILWVGMILAIGMESIVKFNTPTLSKPIGFDIGRTVFAAFNQIQWVLLAILIMGALFASMKLTDRLLIAGIAVTLMLQVFWIFPELSQRVDMVLAGYAPSPTYKHTAYAGLEIAKIFMLLILGIKLLL